MNKFSKYFAAFASLAVLASCSNDEPGNGAENKPDNDGTKAYIAVNIQDANSMSRAGEDPAEGTFLYGDADEHTVKTANFFFFNEDGVYVTQAEVWDGGAAGSEPNVEYMGMNVLVLKGLTQKNPPRYMVTVLNAPESLAEGMLANVSTISDLRNKTLNYTEITNGKDGDEKKDLMLLTTSTYNDDVKGTSETPGYYYGATILTSDNLSTEPIDDANLEDVTPVDVYVERLAAKYSFNGNPEFEIELTVAGEENDQLDERPVGATKVKVTLSGLGITATADKSYLTKHPVKPDLSTANQGWTWDDATNFRSYWGKSYYYDKEDATGLNMTKVGMAIDNAITKPVYSNENTKPFAALQGTDNKVKANLVTNVIFTAKITNLDGTPLNLVNFRGIYYKEDHFKAVVLRTLKERGKLNFWKLVGNNSTTTLTDKGNIIVNSKEYAQVGVSDFEIVRPDPDVKDAHMTLKFTSDNTLYSYNESAAEGSKFTELSTENGKDALNININALLSVNGYPVRYNGGNTYYDIPVQHLLGEDNKYVINGDGEYGIVRNHWYQFTVNKIMNIGNGVFNPSTGDDGDVVTPNVDPDPETFGLAAQVNILAWKIVKQSIDL